MEVVDSGGEGKMSLKWRGEGPVVRGVKSDSVGTRVGVVIFAVVCGCFDVDCIVLCSGVRFDECR